MIYLLPPVVYFLKSLYSDVDVPSMSILSQSHKKTYDPSSTPTSFIFRHLPKTNDNDIVIHPDVQFEFDVLNFACLFLK